MTHETTAKTRPATFQEQAVFGVCPVCQARPGQACIPVVHSELSGKFAHRVRIEQAPDTVEEAIS